MKYNELTLNRQRKDSRVGRGISGGRGKTAGRGTKGQGARKSSTKAGFEGGQMPLHMRLPKLRGFKSKRPIVAEVTTGQLNDLKGASVDTVSLAAANLIPNAHVKVKLIVKGELSAKKAVKLPAATEAAIAMVQKAGGTFTKVEQLGRQATRPAKTDKS